MIVPVVSANDYEASFGSLTGGRRAFVKIGGKPLYRYMADALFETFGKVYVAFRDGVEEKYDVLQVDGDTVGDAIMAARDVATSTDRLLIAEGSVITEKEAVRALVEAAASLGSDGAVLAVPVRSRAGVPLEMSEGLLVGVGGEGQLAYGGMLLIPRDAARAFEGRTLAQALSQLAKTWKIAVAVWGGKWFKVDKPLDLMGALELVMPDATYISAGAKISPTAVIEGPVYIERGAEIDHYAVIKGPAYIGRGAFIGAHALVRNFADVEEDVVVGSSAEITHSLIEPGATIGRGSFVSYSVVGEEAVLEPGVITKSVLREGRGKLKPIEVRGREFYKLGALIGRGTRVEAGALLEPGRGFT
ncbi:MAG: NDP-sugar synthase [Thermoproteus sp.]